MNGRITNDELRSLCIKKEWFTCGSVRQYEKLFNMNDRGAPISEIATVIWLCSDSDKWCRRDIIFELDHAGFTERTIIPEDKHIRDWLGI